MNRNEETAFQAAWMAAHGAFDEVRSGLRFVPGTRDGGRPRVAVFWKLTGRIDCVPNLQREVNSEMVARWGVSWDDVEAAAQENLRNIMK